MPRLNLKYRLYENRRNARLNQTIDCSGIAWNHMVALQRRHYALTGKHIHKYDMARHMAKLRRRSPSFSYLKTIGSQALQDISERQDRTWQAFFKWVKTKSGAKKSPPKFQKVKKYKSFTLKQAGWKYLGENRIKIGKMVYKFALSRPLVGIIKTVTIKRDNLGKMWVTFSVVNDVPEFKNGMSKIGGFDFGLKTFLTNDDGKAYVNPLFLKKELSTIATLNRSLARKVKGSGNWYKAKRRLAKAHEDVSNKRRDFHFKLAKELATTYGIVCFEDLNVSAMTKLWGRKVSDLGFSNFLIIQEYMCKKYGSELVKIGRWQPTTKICSSCGHKQKMELSDRQFDCKECGFSLDRDHNAAINIKRAGASALGLEDVRGATPPILA